MSKVFKRQFLILCLISLVTGVISHQAQAEVRFLDVPSSHWASQSINWSVEMGMVHGYTDGTFQPNRTVSQAEFISMLVRLYHPAIEASPAGAWEQPYFEQASALHWVMPSSARNSPLKRGEAARLMAASSGYNMSEGESILFLLDQRIVAGKTSKTVEGFDASALLTRAEAVQLLQNLYKASPRDQTALPATYLDYKLSGESTVTAATPSFVLLTKRFIGKQLTIYTIPNTLSITLEAAQPEQVIFLSNAQHKYDVSITHTSGNRFDILTSFNFINQASPETIWSQPMDTPLFQFPSLSTDNSQLAIKCSPAAIKLQPSISVRKIETGNSSMAETCSQDGKSTLYFREGPGKYEVTFLDTRGDHLIGLGEWVIRNTDSESRQFLFPETFIESKDPAITTVAAQITEGLSSEIEKARAIHDYVAHNIAYDVEYYYRGADTDISAVKVLERRKAICSGYANLTVALFRAIGIPARDVTGIAGTENIEKALKEDPKNLVKHINHAWTEAFVEGRWLTMDTTWDSGGVGGEADPRFYPNFTLKYFDPLPELFDKDHLKITR